MRIPFGQIYAQYIEHQTTTFAHKMGYRQCSRCEGWFTDPSKDLDIEYLCEDCLKEVNDESR